MEQRNLVPRHAMPSDEHANQEINWGKATRNGLFGVWSVLRAALILLCGLLIAGAVCLYGVQYVQNNFLSPPGDGSQPPVQVIIARGSSLSGISNLLEEKGLIRNSTVFKYYLDFSGFADKLKAGTYIFNDTMSMSEIADSLMRGDEGMRVTGFTIPEGSTVEQIAAILVKDGIIKDSANFLALCKTGEKFTQYDFVKEVRASKNFSQRHYALEGYLFPAKYEIYVSATEEEIINKMLAKFNVIMGVQYRARAKELKMTIDEVATLASMIQRESLPVDHAGASAVFHNRLKIGQRLESDVTVLYAINANKLTVNETERNNPSLYNTYKHKGLPLGPITNPGDAALKAALHPDERIMSEKYYYFVVGDPKDGRLVYNKTLKEHQKDAQIYFDRLRAWQEEQKNQQSATPDPDATPNAEGDDADTGD